MKNILCLTFILAFGLISCNDYNEKTETEIANLQKRKIDKILDKIFVDEYPTYTKNEIVRGKALKELVQKVDSLLPLNYLNDIPLKVWRISKNPHGKGALIHLYADNYSSDRQTLSDRLGFDIIGFMDEDKASKLIDTKKYFVFGSKFNRLTKEETFLIVNQIYYSPRPEITANVIYNDIYNFNIGNFACVIDSLKVVGK
ncbi:MAG: hypothetical protein JST58_13440 [Bacteroidetes bacterium]|nr:hypothetical protein [Bacteroidota bacterium]